MTPREDLVTSQQGADGEPKRRRPGEHIWVGNAVVRIPDDRVAAAADRNGWVEADVLPDRIDVLDVICGLCGGKVKVVGSQPCPYGTKDDGYLRGGNPGERAKRKKNQPGPPAAPAAPPAAEPRVQVTVSSGRLVQPGLNQQLLHAAAVASPPPTTPSLVAVAS